MDERLDFLHHSSPKTLPLSTTFEHRSRESHGPAGVHYWPRRDGSSFVPSHCIVFVLGNPGILDYYLDFLTYLHETLPESFAILSISHIGHSPLLPAPGHPLSLHEQLEAKVEFVEALHSHLRAWQVKDHLASTKAQSSPDGSDEHPCISLIGHSVGAWMACQILKQCPNQVHAVYFLFPTVGWIAQSRNGRRLWPIFHWPLNTLLPSLSYLLRPLLPILTFPAATKSLLRSPRTIRHCLGLGRSEMDNILDPDWEVLRPQEGLEIGRGIHGIWAEERLDGWVGRDGPMVRDVIGGEQGGRVMILNGVPHAFCLTTRNSRLVADTLINWLVPSAHLDPPQPDPSSAKPEAVVPM